MPKFDFQSQFSTSKLDFGRSVNPISTRGTDYAHQLLYAPPTSGLVISNFLQFLCSAFSYKLAKVFFFGDHQIEMFLFLKQDTNAHVQCYVLWANLIAYLSNIFFSRNLFVFMQSQILSKQVS